MLSDELLTSIAPPPNPRLAAAEMTFADETADLEDAIFEVRTLESEAERRRTLEPWTRPLPPGPDPLRLRLAEALRSVTGPSPARIGDVYASMNREMADRGFDPRRLESVERFLGVVYRLLEG